MRLQGKKLKLVPQDTSIDFLGSWKVTFSLSMALMVASVIAFFSIGLNFGIDFRGGTSIRTEASQPVDVGAYRSAMAELALGDVAISEVFDPTFGADQNVAMIRIQAQEGTESVSPAMLAEVEQALRAVDPTLRFTSVESVGPKVSGELVQSAILAVMAALGAVLFYIWLRFEWQFALGAVAALVHDIVLTIGLFSILQIRFDLAIIAALLTIVGYSLNDTVVVFDRMRENLIKYKKRALIEVMNLSLNETLSRTVMTSVTTLLALVSLFVLGGDVIRGFVFAMIWGVIVGTWSSVFVASVVVKRLGVKRDWSKNDTDKGGTQFSTEP
ncbi:MAG: protein translocase subunit SecF [Pararhodobacter sp.]